MARLCMRNCQPAWCFRVFSMGLSDCPVWGSAAGSRLGCRRRQLQPCHAVARPLGGCGSRIACLPSAAIDRVLLCCAQAVVVVTGKEFVARQANISYGCVPLYLPEFDHLQEADIVSRVGSLEALPCPSNCRCSCASVSRAHMFRRSTVTPLAHPDLALRMHLGTLPMCSVCLLARMQVVAFARAQGLAQFVDGSAQGGQLILVQGPSHRLFAKEEDLAEMVFVTHIIGQQAPQVSAVCATVCGKWVGTQAGERRACPLMGRHEHKGVRRRDNFCAVLRLGSAGRAAVWLYVAVHVYLATLVARTAVRHVTSASQVVAASGYDGFNTIAYRSTKVSAFQRAGCARALSPCRTAACLPPLGM